MTALTSTNEDYLKAIWGSREWTEEALTTTDLAIKLGVSTSTVSEAIRRLTDRGLVRHAPYGSIELTEEGNAEALRMVRRHRLLETFLAEYLGYRWDEVHDEAEVMEHAVSDTMIDRLDDLLGRPDRDPHGDPIPGPDGHLPDLPARLLSEVGSGHMHVVERVSDRDPEILRYLTDEGIGLGTSIRVIGRRDFAGTLTVEVNDTRKEIGLPVAEAIWISAEPTS